LNGWLNAWLPLARPVIWPPPLLCSRAALPAVANHENRSDAYTGWLPIGADAGYPSFPGRLHRATDEMGCGG
jgi:hypothetical protein